MDEEHLRLLALFHYVSGGFTILGALMAGVWAALMGAMSFTFPPLPAADEATRQFAMMPVVMAVMVGAFAVLGIAYGVLEIVAGRFITRRRARGFTMLAGLPRLLFMPYGTLLTVVTLVVLERRTVQQIYHSAALVSAQSGDVHAPAE